MSGYRDGNGSPPMNTGGGGGARRTPPFDTWRTRSPNPHSFGGTSGDDRGQPYNSSAAATQQLHRPLLPPQSPHAFPLPLMSGPPPPAPPNMGNQRHYTPRSSYFAANTTNPYFFTNTTSSAPQPPPSAVNQHYGSDYYDSPPISSPPVRPQPYIATNTPAYVHPSEMNTNMLANIDIRNVNQIRDGLNSVNRVVATDSTPVAQSSGLTADSTTAVVSDDLLGEIISQLKGLNQESERVKHQRKQTEQHIQKLDIELKDYEQKFNLREQLRKSRDQFDEQSDDLDRKRKQLTDKMDAYHKVSKGRLTADKTSSGPTVATHRPIITSRSPSKQSPALHSKNTCHSTLKRPVSSLVGQKHTPLMQSKKVRINPIANEVLTPLSSHTKKTPVNQSAAPKRTQTPYRPKPSALATTGTSSPLLASPKVNRICRQQTPGAVLSGSAVTSGVRTSRPVRPGCSRAKRSDAVTAEDVTEPVAETTTEMSDKTSNNSETEALEAAINDNNSGSDPESDNEVFEELSKAIDKDIVSERTVQSIITTQHKESDASDKDNTCLSETNEPIGDKQCDNSEEASDNRATSGSTTTNDDIVTIDSDAEEFTSETVLVKPEPVDHPCPRADSVSSTDTSQSEALHNSSNASGYESAADSGREGVPNKHKSLSVKFTGFEANAYPPSVPYSLGSFKPIAGPNSKTSIAMANVMKTFGDYLLVAFMDHSVRRFHIQDKSDVLRYESHTAVVFAMIIVTDCGGQCPDTTTTTHYLYTGCRDKTLRVFNLMTGQLVTAIQLNDSISCLDYRWNHVFCGLNNGLVCKVAAIHAMDSPPILIVDNTDQLISRYSVNAGKRITAIVAVQTTAKTDDGRYIEPVVAVSPNKLRIINTADSVADERKRILLSLGVSMSVTAPTFVTVFGSNLFVAFKLPDIKNEKGILQSVKKSCVMAYDLQKGWNQVMQMEIPTTITAMDTNGSDLVVGFLDGQIQCFDCHRRQHKWSAYWEKSVSACALVSADRVVLGTADGHVNVLYLAQQLQSCDTCEVGFARQQDLKQHIQIEHSAHT